MAGPPDAVRLVRPVKRRCEAAGRNKEELTKIIQRKRWKTKTSNAEKATKGRL